MSLSIELSGVRYAYKERPGFQLDIPRFAPGPCTALMGKNGGGKTTLGKLISGLIRPGSGVVRYDGRDIAEMKLGQIGARVGYLFQEPSRQIFAPVVLEEIAFPLILRGMPKAEAEEKARAALATFDLSGLETATTYTLSRGEKQRLAIAAAMVCEPRFFVLDEPTTGLDSKRRQLLLRALDQLKARRVGLLVISHDEDFVRELGLAVRHVEGGRLVDG